MDILPVAGFQNISIVDVSATALQVARQRLGARADEVNWIESDIMFPSLGDFCLATYSWRR
jgi:ubiquinone/menaquinone biosynthesis C-methylase UbiE